MRMAAICFAAFLSGCATMPPPSKPASDSRADLVRATLVVRDAEASLALYAGALGMEVMGDRAIGTDNISAPSTGAPGAKGRFIVLRGPDDARGMIGIIQWTDPPMPDAGPYDARLAPGSVVFVLRVADAQAACAAAGEIAGVTVTKPATDASFPGRDGAILRTRTCTLFDPDGNLLELSQRLED